MPELVRSDDLLLNGLITGPAGSGKTSILATANDVPEMSPGLFIDEEGGLISVAHRGDVYHERIKNSAHFEEIFWKLARKEGDFKDFKSVFIDSATEFVARSLDEIVEAGLKAGKREHADDTQLKDYGVNTKRSARLFRWFRNLPLHVLFTALPQNRYPMPPSGAEQRQRFEQQIKLGFVKPLQIVPAMTEKLANAIVGFVDFAWYLDARPSTEEGHEGETVRRLITQPVGPLGWIKTRGAHFSQALGAGQRVEMNEAGVPCIGGVPVMKAIFETFKNTVGTVSA